MFIKPLVCDHLSQVQLVSRYGGAAPFRVNTLDKSSDSELVGR